MQGLRLRIARSTSLEAEREYLRAMSYLNAALALMNKNDRSWNFVPQRSSVAGEPTTNGAH